MQNNRTMVRMREFTAANPKTGKHWEGVVFTGQGRAILKRIGEETGSNEAVVLETIVKRLLVQKGADWTGAILSEYLGLYEDSLGIFTLVWAKQARQLVSHGAVFQSMAHPGAGLVAHIRTADSWQGFGLGTLVTEEVTRAAFAQGARIVALATDDKRHRMQQGEKAAHSMYSRIGYRILAEKELADTVDWLMVIDSQIFERRQEAKRKNGECFPLEISNDLQNLQTCLVEQTRKRFSERLTDGRIQPVSNGDLANLFLLMNLCPPDDFRVKLSAWGIHLGPEFERSFVVGVRPAIADRDRLEDASLALLDNQGAVVAVCAARQAAPFTRNTMQVDFYCLPLFLEKNKQAVVDLIVATLERVQQSPERPKPCRLLFSGADAKKTLLFQGLGFTQTANTYSYFGPDGRMAFEAQEYEKLVV
jgi:GNAT superfamily N-acetyltransferase